MPDKSSRRPLIDPLLLALKSRRVIVALCALAISLLLSVFPALEPLRAELLTLLAALALALIAGYSVEDAASSARQIPPGQDPSDLAKEIAIAIIDQMSDPAASPEDRAQGGPTGPYPSG